MSADGPWTVFDDNEALDFEADDAPVQVWAAVESAKHHPELTPVDRRRVAAEILSEWYEWCVCRLSRN